MGACSVAKLCLTLCNPMDSSPWGSSVHGILQAKILEWVTISYSPGVLQTQGLNPCLLRGRQILYHWATREAPETLVSLKKENTWNVVPAFTESIGWNREKLHKSLINTLIVIWKIFCNHMQTSPKGEKSVFPEETQFEMKGGEQ